MANDGPKGSVRLKLELQGDREYERKVQRAQKAAERAAKEAADAEKKALKEAADARADANRRLREFGETLKSAGGGVGSFTERVAGMSTPLTVAAGAAAAVTGAVVAVAAAAREGAEALYELGMRGGDVSAVATAFERVASPELLGNMSEVTGGLVRELDLMRLANQALRTELVDEETFTRWSQVVTRAAQDTGRDVVRSLEAMTTTLAGGGTESLNQIGVNVLRVNQEVRKLGLSAETEAGRIVALELAMEQLNEDLGEADNSAGNLNDAWTAISVAVSDWTDRVARAFSENQALVQFFGDLQEAMEENAPSAEEMADLLVRLGASGVTALRGLAEAAIPLAQAILRLAQAQAYWQAATNPIEWFTGNSLEFARSVDDIVDGLDTLDSALHTTDEAFENLETALAEGRSGVSDLESSLEEASRSADVFSDRKTPKLTESFNDIGRSAREAAVGVEVLQDRLNQPVPELNIPGLDTPEPEAPAEESVIDEARRLAGERTIAQERERERQEQERNAQRRRTAGQRAARERERLAQEEMRGLEALAAEYQRIKDIEEQRQENIRTAAEETREALARFWQEDGDRQKQAIQDVMEKREEAADRARELREEAAEALEEQIAREQEAVDRQISNAERTISAVGAAAGGAQKLFGGIQELMEATGRGAEESAEAEGRFLIGYSVVMAAVETAEAIVAFAKSRYDEGIAHLAAVAAYGVAAATAAAKLGGGSAESAPMTSAPVRRSEPEPEDRGGGGNGGTYILHQYSFGRTNAEAGDAVRQLEWDSVQDGTETIGLPGSDLG